jgi:hypothetical protein
MDMTAFTELHASMVARHPPKHVCGPDTDIVIEGYPRSANSFTIRMLHVMQTGPKRRHLRIAHHTHNADNLLLGALAGKAQLVLVRKPEDAILSFMIYSERPVELAASRYLRFYRSVLALPAAGKARGRRAVVDFDTVVTDFNAVVTRINAITARSIPLANDLPALVAQVKAEVAEKEAAKGTSIRKLGSPLAEREVLKDALRAEVAAYLQDHPEIEYTYNAMLALR